MEKYGQNDRKWKDIELNQPLLPSHLLCLCWLLAIHLLSIGADGSSLDSFILTRGGCKTQVGSKQGNKVSNNSTCVSIVPSYWGCSLSISWTSRSPRSLLTSDLYNSVTKHVKLNVCCYLLNTLKLTESVFNVHLVP